MTQKWLPGPQPRVTPSDSKVTQKWLKNRVRSHFWVNFRSLWGRSARVTFESLLGHFNSFCVSVDLGARWLHKHRENTLKSLKIPWKHPEVTLKNAWNSWLSVLFPYALCGYALRTLSNHPDQDPNDNELSSEKVPWQLIPLINWGCSNDPWS